MTDTLSDTRLLPGALVCFKPRIIREGEGGVYAVWPGGFNKSGVMMIELNAETIGIFISDYYLIYNEIKYSNILIGETMVVVRADQVAPFVSGL